MKEITKSIENWIKKNKKNVCFVGSFVVFDDHGNVKDDSVVAYGYKDIIEISLEGIEELLKKEKDDFINW